MNSTQDNFPEPEGAGGADSASVSPPQSTDLPVIPATTLPDGRLASSENQPTNELAFQQDETSMSLISEESSPMELAAWGLKRFAEQKKIITTSFGMEGCAMIDMFSKAIEQNDLPKLQVAWIDTGFFFPETLQLRDKLEAKYTNIEFIRWATEVSVEQQKETYGNELWKNNPNLCCNIRKVVPMKKNIGGFDIWITGLRRNQTEARAQTPILAWDWRYQLLKFCPLASWTRPQVWQYVQQNEVPFNQLHLQNYPSVSCFHCTRAVPGSTPDSDARGGRWEGKDKDECGLHFSI
jgi:phosphoadenosine phosphosulfate reductase